MTGESNDEVEQISHEVIIESEQELMKAEALAKLLEKLANALTDKGYAHFIAWFDGSQAQKSGDLQESFLFPLAYADAFWDEEDGSQHRLHVTNSEIFNE